MKTLQDLEAFASLLGHEQKTAIIQQGMTWEVHKNNYTVTVKMGTKFTKVDIGTSGRYMVDLETGEIFGVKAYGVVHKGHRFGTLDTIHEWDWTGYRAHRLSREMASAPIN